MKKLIKMILPPIFFVWLKSFFSQWSGKYENWEKAKKDCDGYNSGEIFSKVYDSAKKVVDGEFPYERDSVLFDEVSYSWPLVTALQYIYLKNGSLNVLDFGGGLGSSYYQNKFFLDQMKNVSWTIVEQKHFVDKGQEEFENGRLRFLPSIDDVFSQSKKIDLILVSSTLQYLENPYEILQSLIDKKPEIIFLDRLSLIESNDDWIAKQTVPPSIYTASYPCRFFSREKIEEAMMSKYRPFGEFECYVPNEGYLAGKMHYKDKTLWYQLEETVKK